MTLYHPPDVDECSDAWGANCGPCALAAALGVPVRGVFEAVAERSLVDDQIPLPLSTFRGWMGIGHMEDAILCLTGRHPTVVRGLPAEGTVAVACVQWSGPWNFTRGAAVHRHWVAIRTDESRPGEGWTSVLLYDVNATHRVELTTVHGTEIPVRVSTELVHRSGGWVALDNWERALVPRLLPNRADGKWWVQWAGVLRL